jgi:hypothetical protein
MAWCSVKAQGRLYFTYRTNFSIPADCARGSVLTNGTANGMIKMILDNQVHVAVDAFGMSVIRAMAVDFTVPLLSTRYIISMWITQYLSSRTISTRTDVSHWP